MAQRFAREPRSRASRADAPSARARGTVMATARRPRPLLPAAPWAALALLACSLLLALCASALPGRALADEAEQAAFEIQSQSSPVTDAVPDELQQRVEETAAAYNEAVARREELEAQAAACQERIDEIEAQLPEARERAAESMYTGYRLQQTGGGLVALLLSSDDFSTLISNLHYIESIQRHNIAQVEELLALTEELEAEQASLDEALAGALEQEQAAAAALEEAKAAREEAQRRAAEQAAREAAERAAAAQAAAAAAAAQASGGDAAADASGSASTGEDAGWSDAGGADAWVDDSGGSASDGADWASDRDVFIAEWGSRIDAYLSGSPLSGYGYVFAAAAWDYGVDPRFSPAIAFVESSLGRYCFLPYNAWGWGSSSWGSWEEAIYSHVAGLAAGYGYTLDYEDALKYCPPTADDWYYSVASQMAQI